MEEQESGGKKNDEQMCTKRQTEQKGEGGWGGSETRSASKFRACRE